MKKIFILLILLLSICSPVVVMAQEATPADVAQNSTIISTDSAVPEPQRVEDYALPYPGLLPDNPLYFLKVTRDAIVGLLITSAEKKAAFDILQADKRLAAAKSLAEKDGKKYKLAVSTLSKAENYMDEAILKTQEAKREGLETHELVVTLKKSISKHKAVITDMLGTAPKEEKEAVAAILKRVVDYEKTINSLVEKDKAK